jgi:RHS repeat-associated protein
LLDITPRGYTGHESVDHADIIHMNGRIYDSTLGRFLQADPLIQAPDNSQSYNRYAYVFNNPLKYTDPSGYSAWTNFRDKVLKPFAGVIVGIALGMVCGPQCG